jgi:hypothetical protein
MIGCKRVVVVVVIVVNVGVDNTRFLGETRFIRGHGCGTCGGNSAYEFK